MSPEDRKALAEQLLTNPLTDIIIDEMESDAIERGVNADLDDHNARLTAMLEVHAVRDFRTKLQLCAEDNRKRKAAPA